MDAPGQIALKLISRGDIKFAASSGLMTFYKTVELTYTGGKNGKTIMAAFGRAD